MEKIRILIVDDHPVVHQGIQLIVNTEPTLQIVGSAQDGVQAIDLVKKLQPDVVLMDLMMPRGGGIEAITRINCDYPSIRIIALTTFEDINLINAAVEAGADGYLLKDADGETLLQAIQAVQQGGMPLHPRVARHLFGDTTKSKETNNTSHLTERENEVLQLVTRGLSNKDIAHALNLTEGTVRGHVGNILDKLNLLNRTEAAVWAVQQGLVLPHEED